MMMLSIRVKLENKETASSFPLLTSLIDAGFSTTECAGRGSIMNCAAGFEELFSSLSFQGKREEDIMNFLCPIHFSFYFIQI